MLKTTAEAIGKGLLAGLAGTAAMTLSSTIEMKLRGREASNTPAEAASKVLGVKPNTAQGKERFSRIAHWGYGTGWGVTRGLIGAAGLDGAVAGVAHFAAVWSAEQVMLPTLGVAPPFWRWGAREVALDALHHAVYAAATGWAYDRLERSGPPRRGWHLSKS